MVLRIQWTSSNIFIMICILVSSHPDQRISSWVPALIAKKSTKLVYSQMAPLQKSSVSSKPMNVFLPSLTEATMRIKMYRWACWHCKWYNDHEWINDIPVQRRLYSLILLSFSVLPVYCLSPSMNSWKLFQLVTTFSLVSFFTSSKNIHKINGKDGNNM